ncbi:MAG: stage 0 sporulation family protein [bacterium]
MDKVVGISFRRAGKVYLFTTGGLELSEEEWVIVETARGREIGQVVAGPRDMQEEDSSTTLKGVMRKATQKDFIAARELEMKAMEAFRIGEAKIKFHKLPMKLLEVEYTLDGGKIIFCFSAEGRVDFRDLVKDLASVFRKRIELHQIGVRDEAKMLGGLGCCGRSLCCATFLTEFAPVSIKMAKEQNLSLNPVKISGTCGRLMCCLKYEHDFYHEARKRLPSIGSEVQMDDEGIGVVVDVNVPKDTVIVELPSKARLEMPGGQARVISKKEGKSKPKAEKEK